MGRAQTRFELTGVHPAVGTTEFRCGADDANVGRDRKRCRLAGCGAQGRERILDGGRESDFWLGGEGVTGSEGRARTRK